MATVQDIKDDADYYGMLGVEVGASKAEIAKAYKHRALKLHPDKNPDDPDAAQKFQEVKKAYEILMDDKVREAFNNLMRARQERKKRNENMDAKRRKMKEELEEREERARKGRQEEEDAKREFQRELARLKAEMQKLKETQQKKQQEELQRKAAAVESESQTPSHLSCTLKVLWDRKISDYSKEKLTEIFQMFGTLDYIVVGTKKTKGNAIVGFKEQNAARLAASQHLGEPGNSLHISWASGKPPADTHSSAPTQPAPSTGQSPVVVAASSLFGFNVGPPQKVTLAEHEDFEAQVMRRMKEAAAARQHQQQQHQNQATPLAT